MLLKVRSFCNDFAKKLKTIAYVSALRRTKSGKYDLKHALSLDTYLCQNKPIKIV